MNQSERRYEKVVPVASGGMASVWTARRRGPGGFDKIVAIKTMLPELAGEADYRTMFLDEARVASRLSHPNICETFDAGEDPDGELFLAMEWIDGVSLHRLLRPLRQDDRRAIAPALAAKIIADACAGLHAAHETLDAEGAPLAIVHRDVSPQNLLLAADGRVKVTDFGIACARGKQHATAAGQAKGKIAYMAPEQLKGRAAGIDRRTDVFALGAVLYEISTGQRPFDGVSELETMRAILERTPPAPSSIVAGYPAELERILVRALAKNPEDRFASAEGLRIALVRWARATGGEPSSRAIAELVDERCGEEIRARRAQIQAALALVPASDGAPPRRSPRADRFRRAVLALGIAVVSLGGVTVARSELLARSPTPVGPDAPARVALPARSAPAVPTVAPTETPRPETPAGSIVVRTEPPTAELFVDGQLVRALGTGEPSIERPAPGEIRVVIAKAPGFVDRLVVVDEASPATVEFALAPSAFADGPSLVSER